MTLHFDVERFLSDHKIFYKTHGKNVGVNDVNIKCIYCDDPSYHLAIHKEKGIFHCWRCQTRGDFVKLISDLLHVSIKKAKEISKSYSHTTSTKDILIENTKCVEDILPDNAYLLSVKYSDYFVETSRKLALHYLKQRHINPFNKNWFFTPYGRASTDSLVVIPITFEGEVVSWIGRRYTRQQPRYINCPSKKAKMKLKNLIYNYDNLPANDVIFLCEGIFDALRFGKHGTATFGKNFSEEQLLLLARKKPAKVFYVVDNEGITEAEIANNMKLLKLFFNVEILKPPYIFKDVGEMKKSEVVEWLSDILGKEEAERILNG